MIFKVVIFALVAYALYRMFMNAVSYTHLTLPTNSKV